jgi:hypothetical protein
LIMSIGMILICFSVLRDKVWTFHQKLDVK